MTIQLHQAVRATTPVLTIMIQRLFIGTRRSRSVYISLVPVVVGVILATKGEYQTTKLGIALTFMGVASSAMKTVVTDQFMETSSALHLLHQTSGPACIYAFLAALTSGELMAYLSLTSRAQWQGTIAQLLINGTCAFALNVASFVADKNIGALILMVVANVKQAATVLIAVTIWGTRMELIQALGVALTFASGLAFGLSKRFDPG